MSTPGREITPAVRALLSAIFDALDVPFPEEYGDWEKHHQLLSSRAAITRGALQQVAAGQDVTTLESMTSAIRRYASDPPGYEPWHPKPGRPGPGEASS